MKPKIGDIIIIGEDGFAIRGNILDIFLVINIGNQLYLEDETKYTIYIQNVHPRLRKKFIKIGEL